MSDATELTDIHESVRPEKIVRRLDRLALMFEGILTVTERVQTGRQQLQDPEEFRSRMKKALEDVARTATRRGYGEKAVDEGTFAVVAFLDEAILTALHEQASNWVGKSLEEELFGQREAGERFFKRLEALRARRDSQDLAEVLEVYFLCLLLGYEGKFAGGAKGELLQLTSNLRERIDRIYSGGEQDSEFSPDLEMGFEPPPVVVAADPINRQLRLFALASLAFALLCYFGFSLALHSQTRKIHQLVVERMTPSIRSDGGARP